MIPAGESPDDLRKDVEIQAVEEAWEDQFDRAMEGVPGFKDTPIRDLETRDLLVLAHYLITREEPLDAADLVYEAWKRIWAHEHE